jgi:hypothetical protein
LDEAAASAAGSSLVGVPDAPQRIVKIPPHMA